jgi:glycosyltransferase involved in cell wall biosynthesis
LSARLILIDQSIKGLTGHHLEYALHVLRAAERAGYEPMLATNRRFTQTADLSFSVFRQYKYGYWDQPFFSGRNAAMKSAYRFLRDFAKCGKRKDGPHPGPLPRGEGTNECPHLGFVPRGEGTGLKKLVRSAADCWKNFFSEPIRVGQFVRDTKSLLRRIQPARGDIIFLPGAGYVELEGAVRLLQCDAARRATWRLVFRRDPPELRSGHDASRLYANAFRRAADHISAGRMFFYTDTEELSAQYQMLSSLPFQTLPIPHTHSPAERARPAGGPLRILYLGDARREKGYHLLPGIIRAIWDDAIAAKRAALTIQSNPPLTDDEPGIAAAREQLRSLAGESLELLSDALSSEQYRRLLLSGDLVLLPYDAAAYRWRSSGVLVEALGAGIPAIVPADTWLAHQVPPGAGRIFSDVGQVPAAIREMLDNYDRYRQSALENAQRWTEKHNAANLVEMLSRP